MTHPTKPIPELPKIVLGIDPGLSGGLLVSIDGERGAYPWTNEADFVEVVKGFRNASLARHGGIIAYVELVGGYVGKEDPGSRMFTFGDNYGFIRGVLAAFDIPTVLVRPQVWQSDIAVGSGDKAARKKKLLAYAQKKFPELKLNAKTGDAACILNYALGIEAKKAAKGIKHAVEKDNPHLPKDYVDKLEKKHANRRPLAYFGDDKILAGEIKQRDKDETRSLVAKPTGRPPLPSIPSTELMQYKGTPQWLRKPDSAHYTAVNALPYEVQARMAEDWAKARKLPIPKRRTAEFSDLFTQWYNLAINGDA